MQHWQQQARNRALGDKRKAAKQGNAIVDWMRSKHDRDRKEQVQENGGVDAVQDVDIKDPWEKV